MAIQEPETRKRYTSQPTPHTTRAPAPRRRRFTPRRNRGPAGFIQYVRSLLRERREARILDGLAADAIREYRAGHTTSLRDYAHERGISLDDQR